MRRARTHRVELGRERLEVGDRLHAHISTRLGDEGAREGELRERIECSTGSDERFGMGFFAF